MSDLTGLISKAIADTPGWESSTVLPIQRRTGPAPAPVMGMDESGKLQEFHQPAYALGVPKGLINTVQSVTIPAEQLDQGKTPGVEDVAPFIENLALGSLGVRGSADTLLSAGAKIPPEVSDLINASVDRRQVLQGIGSAAATAAIKPKVSFGTTLPTPTTPKGLVHPQTIKKLWDNVMDGIDNADYDWPEMDDAVVAARELHKKALSKATSDVEKNAHQNAIDQASDYLKWMDHNKDGLDDYGGPEDEDHDNTALREEHDQRWNEVLGASDDARATMPAPFPKIPKDVTKLTDPSRIETLKDRLSTYMESAGTSKMDRDIAQAHIDRLDARQDQITRVQPQSDSDIRINQFIKDWKAGQPPTLFDVRPAKENVADVIDSNFPFGGRIVGDKNVSIDDLTGGTTVDTGDASKVKSLASQIASPDGYFERLLVDQHGNVIEGQHRLDAARSLGLKEVPVTVVRDNAAGFDTDAMHRAVRDVGGLHPDQQHKVVERALDVLHDAGSKDGALEYELPGFDDHFQAAIKASSPEPKPTITPASIAREHALDMATNDRLAAQDAKPSPSFAGLSIKQLEDLYRANISRGAKPDSPKMSELRSTLQALRQRDQ